MLVRRRLDAGLKLVGCWLDAGWMLVLLTHKHAVSEQSSPSDPFIIFIKTSCQNKLFVCCCVVVVDLSTVV